MIRRPKSGPHRAAGATERAANRWCVAPSKIVVRETDGETRDRTITCGAPDSTNEASDRRRARALATAIVTLATEDGLDAAFEAIERGLMGMSVLPDDERARSDLRGLSELMDIAAERLGLRGGGTRA